MKILITNALICNEGTENQGSVLIDGEYIAQIEYGKDTLLNGFDGEIINAGGKILMPGVIDDQVHFREPGMTHKADIESETRAAIAGGVTSIMEMPNTNPPTITIEALDAKFALGEEKSYANYSFYLGATNDNIEEIKKIDPQRVCGVKVFMGSSTGNMLVNDDKALEQIFEHSPCLIATHCEDEALIEAKKEEYKAKYGNNIPVKYHPEIRNAEACYKSSSKAIALAKKHRSRLHVLHLTTAMEMKQFANNKDLEDKLITAEVCVHHLRYSDKDYDVLGSKIKCNPAVKSADDREALWEALIDGRLDVVATDHAPHTKEEKANVNYFKCPAGLPLVQFSLPMFADMVFKRNLPFSFVVDKMCHAPAKAYKVHKRGYIREGYFADLVLLSRDISTEVKVANIYSKCAWSPMEGEQFNIMIDTTIINGKVVYKTENNGKEIILDKNRNAKALTFDR
ncbi:MAG: dihydroorotase [Bacteroidales bacterium]